MDSAGSNINTTLHEIDPLYLSPGMEISHGFKGPEVDDRIAHTSHFTQGAEHFAPGTDPLEKVVQPHLDSFNFFLETGIHESIRDIPPAIFYKENYPKITSMLCYLISNSIHCC